MAMVLQKRSADFEASPEDNEHITDLKKRRLDPPMQSESKKTVQGNVTVGQSQGVSSLLDSFSTYPLRLIQQENWNKSHVTITMLGFGGGLLAGDSVNVNLTVEPGSSACFRTPGTTKVFKSKDGRSCHQEIVGDIQKDAFFVMIPDPVTCYEHARFNQIQRYTVDETGTTSAVIVDWFTSGRENKHEFWNFDSFNNSITLLNQDNKFLLVENQCVQNNNPENNCNSFGFLAKEFSNVHLCGILILYGKKTEAIRASLACFQNRQTYSERFAELENEAQEKTGKQIPLLSVSTINANLTMVRFMIPTVQYGYELLAEILSPLQAELPGLLPYQDRIHYQQHDPESSASSRALCPIEILKAYRRQEK